MPHQVVQWRKRERHGCFLQGKPDGAIYEFVQSPPASGQPSRLLRRAVKDHIRSVPYQTQALTIRLGCSWQKVAAVLPQRSSPTNACGPVAHRFGLACVQVTELYRKERVVLKCSQIGRKPPAGWYREGDPIPRATQREATVTDTVTGRRIHIELDGDTDPTAEDFCAEARMRSDHEWVGGESP